MCEVLLARQPPQFFTSSLFAGSSLSILYKHWKCSDWSILIWNSLCSVTCPNMNKCEGKEPFCLIIIENSLPVKSCCFHKDRDCLDQGREVRFRSWGEWCVVIITLRISAAFLIQRSEPCLQYITTAGYVILCKLLPKFHNSCNKQESLN